MSMKKSTVSVSVNVSDSQLRKYFTDCLFIGVLKVIDTHDSSQFLTKYFKHFITDPSSEFPGYGEVVRNPIFLQKFLQEESEYVINSSPSNIAEVVVKLANEIKMFRENAKEYFNNENDPSREMRKRATYLTDFLLLMLRIQLRIFHAIALDDAGNLSTVAYELFKKEVTIPSSFLKSSLETTCLANLMDEKASTDDFITFLLREIEFRLPTATSNGNRNVNIYNYLQELQLKKIFRSYSSLKLPERKLQQVIIDEVMRSNPIDAEDEEEILSFSDTDVKVGGKRKRGDEVKLTSTEDVDSGVKKHVKISEVTAPVPSSVSKKRSDATSSSSNSSGGKNKKAAPTSTAALASSLTKFLHKAKEQNTKNETTTDSTVKGPAAMVNRLNEEYEVCLAVKRKVACYTAMLETQLLYFHHIDNNLLNTFLNADDQHAKEILCQLLSSLHPSTSSASSTS